MTTTLPPDAAPARHVPLSSLTIEPALQARNAHLDPTTVNRYRGTIKAAEGDKGRIPFPPVTVARLGASLYLVDGFHRYAAHRDERVSSILAIVVEVGSVKEAQWLAAKGNLQHGKQLSNKEVREAFRRFVAAREHHKADPEASPKVMEQRPRPGVMTLGEIGAVFGKAKSTTLIWFKRDYPKEFNQLYCKDAERDGEGALGGDRPALDVSRAPSPLDLVDLSLANVARLVRQSATPAEKRGLIERLGEELVECAMPIGDDVAELQVTLDRNPFITRKAVIRVQMGE